MFKKFLMATIGIVMLASTGMAQDTAKKPVVAQKELGKELFEKNKNQKDFKLVFRADIRAYAKIQDNHYTALTSSVRQGSQNRESQKFRAFGEFVLMALAGENTYKGSKWYKWMAFTRLSVNSQDPDLTSIDQSTDGVRATKIWDSETWVRYAPHVAVGVTIGTQSIYATANSINNYRFEGDRDDDYRAFANASYVGSYPGIAIDLHPTKNIELGVALLEGASDGSSAIVYTPEKAEQNTTVFWFKGKLGPIDTSMSYQMASVGGTDETTQADPDVTSQYAHRYKHNITTFALAVNIGKSKLNAGKGKIRPYIGYLSARGDQAGDLKIDTSTGSTLDTLNTSLSALKTSGLSISGAISGSSREKDITAVTYGVSADIGPGTFAIEYTDMQTKDLFEEGWSESLIGLDYTVMTNYTVPVTKNAKITFFYHSSISADKSDLNTYIATLTSDAALVAASGTATTVITAAGSSQAAVATGYATVIAGLEAMKWNTHHSYGVQFAYKFGNQ
ncbi:MAG: hypothetical protein ACI86H_001212 [bacterium]|jgi:hypothetical protein